MRHVRQEEPDGCGVACLAMLTDATYEEVAKTVVAIGLGNPSDLKPEIMRRYLEAHGWFTRCVLTRAEAGGRWPPEPFAPAHCAMVQRTMSSPGHWVVMLGDGGVLDPNRVIHQTLRDFKVCSMVYGLIAPLHQHGYGIIELPT